MGCKVSCMVLMIMCQTCANVALLTTFPGHFSGLIVATWKFFYLGAGHLLYNFVKTASMAMSNASAVAGNLVSEDFAFAGG